MIAAAPATPEAMTGGKIAMLVYLTRTSMGWYLMTSRPPVFSVARNGTMQPWARRADPVHVPMDPTTGYLLAGLAPQDNQPVARWITARDPDEGIVDPVHERANVLRELVDGWTGEPGEWRVWSVDEDCATLYYAHHPFLGQLTPSPWPAAQTIWRAQIAGGAPPSERKRNDEIGRGED